MLSCRSGRWEPRRSRCRRWPTSPNSSPRALTEAQTRGTAQIDVVDVKLWPGRSPSPAMVRVGKPCGVVIALALAVMFGFMVALLKGQGVGLRYALGNLSAPWLLIAFWCGGQVRCRAAGAVLGVAGTLLALAGFCLGLALISDYGTVSAMADVHLAFRANTRYFEAGLISGPLLGALGATSERRDTHRTLISGLLFLAEPSAAVSMRHLHILTGLTGEWSAPLSTAYVIEGLSGAILIAAALLGRRSAERRPRYGVVSDQPARTGNPPCPSRWT